MIDFFNDPFQKLYQMNDFPHHSMEMIAQETSRMQSESHLKDSESPSFELLIKAHDRIRNLQAQNQELYTELNKREHNDVKIVQFQNEISRLVNLLKERDLKIQNLQRINEKAITDLVFMEKQLNLFKCQSSKYRKNVTPIPSELNSPLHLSKINKKTNENEAQDPQNQFSRVNLQCAKDFLVKQQKLMLNRCDNKWKNCEIFTFDKQNGERGFTSPQRSNKKILKNCFSELEINHLIKKVNSRQDHKFYQARQNMKHYHNYCSSMEKKYSPNTAIKKQTTSINLLKKSPALTLKSPSHQYKTSKYSSNFSEKPWMETSTCNGTTASFGLFNDFSQKKLHFY